MKRLVILHSRHGDLTVTDKGEIKEHFYKILRAGYGGPGNVPIPAVFIAEKADKTLERFDTKHFYENGVDVLIDDPEVEEVTVIAPIAGG
jgi:hypothetical protein